MPETDTSTPRPTTHRIEAAGFAGWQVRVGPKMVCVCPTELDAAAVAKKLDAHDTLVAALQTTLEVLEHNYAADADKDWHISACVHAQNALKLAEAP